MTTIRVRGLNTVRLLVVSVTIFCMFLPGISEGAVYRDAYSYQDEFTDSTGLNLQETQNMSFSEGALTAESIGAVAVSECIRLPQPAGGTFRQWSFLEIGLADSQTGRLEIQNCDGQTLRVMTSSLVTGSNQIELPDTLPADIRLKWTAEQADSALEYWKVYGVSDGATTLEVIPTTALPNAGDTMTFSIHIASSGTITRNPVLRMSLDDINGLHTPDIDDGLAEDAENDYGSGVEPYKPLKFVSASVGPNGEQPQIPASGATSGEILWHLDDLSDGFSDDLTVVFRNPKGYIHGKTIAARASLRYGTKRGSLSNKMTLESTSQAVSVNAVYAYDQKSWTPYDRVGIGAICIYDYYAIWNTEAVYHPNASDAEDVTFTITHAPEGECAPAYNRNEVKSSYNFQVVSEPAKGTPITAATPLIIHFDRINFYNERSAVSVYYDVPASCPGGSQIGTRSTLIGHLPQWQDQDVRLHGTPLPGDSDCRKGSNITIRTASGQLNNDYDRWPGWDEYYIKDGSVKAGEYVLTESPRGTESNRTQVSTLDHSYALFTVPAGATFHGVRNHEWLSHLYKDSSGLAPVPNHDDFDHNDPTNSGWEEVDIAWNGAPFEDAPDELNSRAIVAPGSRLLAVKDNDRPAWVGPDYGNWRPYFLWRICDGSDGCAEPADGEPIELISGAIYSYSGNDVARECESYPGWMLYKEAKSWPKVYTWAEQEQVPGGQVAHIVLTPENQNKASQYVDGRWGFNLFNVKEFINLKGVTGEVLTDGLQVPEPNQNIAGQSCNIAEITFHLPNASACQQTDDADDPDCMAWWDVPAACQPPNGWGNMIPGGRNHDHYISMFTFRLNLPVLNTTPAHTVLNVVAEVRTTDLSSRGADNVVDPARWSQGNYTATVPITVLEVPGIDAENSGPLSKKVGDRLTYHLTLKNSGNAPNNGIYGVEQLPKNGVNGSEFTPEYHQVYVNQVAGNVMLEYSTDESCFTNPATGSWTAMALRSTIRAGYQTETVERVNSEAACLRLRRHPEAQIHVNPGDVFEMAFDAQIPSDTSLEGQWLYNRALTGAVLEFGAHTNVDPVETLNVRTVVSSDIVVNIEKSVEIDPTRAGYITWMLHVYNVSGSQAVNISVVDDLPQEIIYQELAEALPSGVTCVEPDCAVVNANSDGSGGQVRFLIERLLADDGNPGMGDDERTISFRTQVKGGLPDGTVIENWASAIPETGTGGQDDAVAAIARITVSKEQEAIDRILGTDEMNVNAGDSIHYTITATNEFEQAVFMMAHDTFDSLVDYIAGTFQVNGATASDGFITDGALNYRHAELLAPGETLTLAFDVSVKDSDFEEGIIENIAMLTPYLNPLDQATYFVGKQTNQTVAYIGGYAPAPGPEPVPTTAPVPEPSTVVIFGTGLLGIWGLLRNKRK